MILQDAGKDQGVVGAAEGPSQQLTVLREAAGFGMGILADAGRNQGGWSVFFECPAGKVLSREDHWLRVPLPAGVKFRVGCGPSLAACHRFRGGRALWVSPVGKPRRAGPVGKPCGQALLRGIFL